MDLPKLNQSDWGYTNVEPDPDFDAKNNKRIINEIIRKNEINWKRKKREQKEELGEKSQAVASYVKHLSKTKGNTKPEDYFGKRYFTKLRGREIVDILKHAKKQKKGS